MSQVPTGGTPSQRVGIDGPSNTPAIRQQIRTIQAPVTETAVSDTARIAGEFLETVGAAGNLAGNVARSSRARKARERVEAERDARLFVLEDGSVGKIAEKVASGAYENDEEKPLEERYFSWLTAHLAENGIDDPDAVRAAFLQTSRTADEYFTNLSREADRIDRNDRDSAFGSGLAGSKTVEEVNALADAYVEDGGTEAEWRALRKKVRDEVAVSDIDDEAFAAISGDGWESSRANAARQSAKRTREIQRQADAVTEFNGRLAEMANGGVPVAERIRWLKEQKEDERLRDPNVIEIMIQDLAASGTAAQVRAAKERMENFTIQSMIGGFGRDGWGRADVQRQMIREGWNIDESGTLSTTAIDPTTGAEITLEVKRSDVDNAFISAVTTLSPDDPESQVLALYNENILHPEAAYHADRMMEGLREGVTTGATADSFDWLNKNLYGTPAMGHPDLNQGAIAGLKYMGRVNANSQVKISGRQALDTLAGRFRDGNIEIAPVTAEAREAASGLITPFRESTLDDATTHRAIDPSSPDLTKAHENILKGEYLIHEADGVSSGMPREMISNPRINSDGTYRRFSRWAMSRMEEVTNHPVDQKHMVFVPATGGSVDIWYRDPDTGDDIALGRTISPAEWRVIQDDFMDVLVDDAIETQDNRERAASFADELTPGVLGASPARPFAYAMGMTYNVALDVNEFVADTAKSVGSEVRDTANEVGMDVSDIFARSGLSVYQWWRRANGGGPGRDIERLERAAVNQEVQRRRDSE